MGFLDGLLSTLQDWDNKSNEYYSQYVGMSTEALKQEYKRVGGTSSRGMAIMKVLRDRGEIKPV